MLLISLWYAVPFFIRVASSTRDSIRWRGADYYIRQGPLVPVSTAYDSVPYSTHMDSLKLKPDPRLEPAPEPTAFDYGLAIAKVGALAFPFLGVGVTLVDLITAPLRGKRLIDWCEEIRLRLNEVSQTVGGLTPETLATNDVFISAFGQATQAALRTHQREKLDALRNAVVNVAIGVEPNADRQQSFLSLADRFSETHLILLRFFRDPAGHFQRKGKPVPNIKAFPKLLVYQLVCEAMPALSQDVKSQSGDRTAASFQFVELVLQDLVSAKLITLERLNETWAVPKFDQNPMPSPVRQLTTHLGDDFLAFIAGPEEEE